MTSSILWILLLCFNPFQKTIAFDEDPPYINPLAKASFLVEEVNQNFEFETNLSLGTSLTGGISYDVLRENRFLEGSLGIGISRVNLDNNNSNLGSVDNPSQTALEQTAFTVSLGIVFYYDGLNAGLFLGWDHLSGKAQKQFEWIHNQKPWLGIGVNIGIGKSENENNSNLVKNKS